MVNKGACGQSGRTTGNRAQHALRAERPHQVLVEIVELQIGYGVIPTGVRTVNSAATRFNSTISGTRLVTPAGTAPVSLEKYRKYIPEAGSSD